MNPILAGPLGIHCGNLILVNACHPVRLETAEPCVPLPGSSVRLQQRAAAVLQHMLSNLGCSGQILPVSGYRRFAEQQQIWDDSMRNHGESFTRQYVALPGCSEHQTGLAIDLGLNEGEIDFIRPNFPYEGVCQRFRKAAPQYGFIERYPSGKEAVTGIAHEAWHFRYVGVPHAQIMARRNMVLEEYIEYLKQFPQNGPHLVETCGSRPFEIYYLPAEQAGRRRQEDSSLYEISGNNVDGYIVTLWRHTV